MSYLVVDMDRVLAESEHGKAAQASLKAVLRRADVERGELKAKLQRAKGTQAQRAAREALVEHRRRVAKELDKRRGALRDALIDLVKKVTRDLAEERGVDLVIERQAALVYGDDRDVTDEVIRRVDAVRVSAPSSRS